MNSRSRSRIQLWSLPIGFACIALLLICLFGCQGVKSALWNPFSSSSASGSEVPSSDPFQEPFDAVGDRRPLDSGRDRASGGDAGRQRLAPLRRWGSPDLAQRYCPGVPDLAGGSGADRDWGNQPDMGGTRGSQGHSHSQKSFIGRVVMFASANGLLIGIIVAVVAAGAALAYRKRIFKFFKRGAK